MASLPNFNDPALFPAFHSIPLVTDPHNHSSEKNPHYILIGTISQNMTLSTNPTFICADRDAVPFAVTVKLGAGGGGGGGRGFDVKACRKGYSMAVVGARRSGVREGKQGFVEVGPGDVRILPTTIAKLLELSTNQPLSSDSSSSSSSSRSCQACNTEKNTDQLSRCTGCSEVWYCNKTCQVIGWRDKGHKGECKVLNAVKGLGDVIAGME